MADFHLWTKASLVKFAEEVTPRLLEQEAAIAQLQADLKVAMEAWRKALAQPVAGATLKP